MDENQSQSKGRIQNNRRQLLILGHRNGWMTMYKFTVSVTGQISCNKVGHSSMNLLSSQLFVSGILDLHRSNIFTDY